MDFNLKLTERHATIINNIKRRWTIGTNTKALLKTIELAESLEIQLLKAEKKLLDQQKDIDHNNELFFKIRQAEEAKKQLKIKAGIEL